MAKKKGRLPWFKCYPSKMLGAMGAMGPDENLVYLTILLRIYEVGGPAKDDARTISRRCGLTQRRVQAALDTLSDEGKIVVENGLIDSESTHEILKDFEIFQTKAKKSGKAGAEKRWKKGLQNQQCDVADPTWENSELIGTETIDVDIRQEKETPGGVSKKPPKRTSIEEGAKPTDSQVDYALKSGMCEQTLRFQWSQFKDYNLGRGSRSADWEATWRSWVGIWAERNGETIPDEMDK